MSRITNRNISVLSRGTEWPQTAVEEYVWWKLPAPENALLFGDRVPGSIPEGTEKVYILYAGIDTEWAMDPIRDAMARKIPLECIALPETLPRADAASELAWHYRSIQEADGALSKWMGANGWIPESGLIPAKEYYGLLAKHRCEKYHTSMEGEK